MSLLVVLLLLAAADTSHSLVSHYTTSGGVISHYTTWQAARLQELAEFIHYDLRWKYYTTDDGINWQLNFNDILQSRVTDDIIELVGVKREKVQFQNATARILRRGDDTKINRVCQEATESGMVVLLVLYTPPGSNDYGEILFFNDVISDVTATVRPGDYSLISFPCRQPYQWQYPAIQTQRGLIFIQFLFLEQSFVDGHSVLDNSHKPFPSISGPYKKLTETDLQVTVTSSFHLTPEKGVYVVDSVFEDDVLSELARHFLDDSCYIYNEEDEGEYSDNVVFLTPQLPHQLAATRLWGLLQRVLVHLTGKDSWYPYDVSNNLNEPWDHTRIHPDCFGRDEYTVLLYLNKEYRPGDLGGTVWYREENGDHIIGSVLNKFGRLAVFHCSIPHSARPPHAYRPGPRLTFAVKVAEGRDEAIVRTMSESAANRGEEDEDETERLLWDRLHRELEGDGTRLELEYQDLVREWEEDQVEVLSEVLRTAGDLPRHNARDEL